MKQFQKYGVAAAVASVAAGAVAQEVSDLESGDLALIPYYTVLDGKNTGMHIINTTDNTQVVKVRLRRGADSKDALDFNLVMSPRDEWTANIGENPDGDGVIVTTNDSTCTVPEFPEGGAVMPSTYAEGAEEGYVEIIGMGQPDSENSHLAAAAKHQIATTGMPLSCDIVRSNFFRVTGNPAIVAADGSVRGTHTSRVVSSGQCTGVGLPAAISALCPLGTASNITTMADAADNALKVSYFITDSSGGLEAGDNAVHVAGFAAAPMMTNQQPLSFGTAQILRFDPLNFELPNLAYGAYESDVPARQTDGASGATAISDGSLFDGVRAALDSLAVINDWAAFEAADGSNVAADWVLTLPGQYTMNNPICEVYDSYAQAGTNACTTAQRALAAADGGDELPLILSSPDVPDPLTGGSSRLALWDREEMPLTNPETPSSDDLGFSPGGSAGDPTRVAVLNREVNVISWDGEAGECTGLSSLNTAALQDEDLGLGVCVEIPGDSDRGWAQMTIDPQTAAVGTVDFGGIVGDDEDLTPTLGVTATTNAVASNQDTAVVAIAVWERSFADQAGNYGRIVEHSTIVSSGSGR